MSGPESPSSAPARRQSKCDALETSPVRREPADSRAVAPARWCDAWENGRLGEPACSAEYPKALGFSGTNHQRVSMRGHSGGKSQQLFFTQDARRFFCGVQQPRNQRVVSWDTAALEPEKHVGLPTHRPDFDYLVEPEQVRWHAAVDDVGKL